MPCDHMIEADPTYCYAGLRFPRDCRQGCSRYLSEETPPEPERERIWAMFVGGGAEMYGARPVVTPR
jgi:hypothetical protein